MENITVIKFFAPWCKPCKIYNHAFNRVTERMGVRTVHVNVDTDTLMKNQYNISNIPTTVILKDGVEVDRATGALIERNLTTMIEKAIL